MRSSTIIWRGTKVETREVKSFSKLDELSGLKFYPHDHHNPINKIDRMR